MGKSNVALVEGNLSRTSAQDFPKLSKTLAWNSSFPRKLWVRKDEECLPASHPTSALTVPEEKKRLWSNVSIESETAEDVQANRAAAK